MTPSARPGLTGTGLLFLAISEYALSTFTNFIRSRFSSWSRKLCICRNARLGHLEQAVLHVAQAVLALAFDLLVLVLRVLEVEAGVVSVRDTWDKFSKTSLDRKNHLGFPGASAAWRPPASSSPPPPQPPYPGQGQWECVQSIRSSSHLLQVAALSQDLCPATPHPGRDRDTWGNNLWDFQQHQPTLPQRAFMEEKISSVKIRSAETEIDHFRLCRLSTPMNHRTKDAYPISPARTLTNDFKFLSNCWQTEFCIIWFIMPFSPWVSHLSLEKKTILPQKLVSLDLSLSASRSENKTSEQIQSKWVSILNHRLHWSAKQTQIIRKCANYQTATHQLLLSY